MVYLTLDTAVSPVLCCWGGGFGRGIQVTIDTLGQTIYSMYRTYSTVCTVPVSKDEFEQKESKVPNSTFMCLFDFCSNTWGECQLFGRLWSTTYCFNFIIILYVLSKGRAQSRSYKLSSPLPSTAWGISRTGTTWTSSSVRLEPFCSLPSFVRCNEMRPT
jgi:hypothetical protein